MHRILPPATAPHHPFAAFQLPTIHGPAMVPPLLAPKALALSCWWALPCNLPHTLQPNTYTKPPTSPPRHAAPLTAIPRPLTCWWALRCSLPPTDLTHGPYHLSAVHPSSHSSPRPLTCWWRCTAPPATTPSSCRGGAPWWRCCRTSSLAAGPTSTTPPCWSWTRRCGKLLLAEPCCCLPPAPCRCCYAHPTELEHR